MELIAQIPDITIGRAANAPHYEYREQLRQYFPTLKRWQKK